MIVAVILACEIGFWILLAGGLAVRYVLRRPRLGAAILMCVPLVDLLLLAVTVIDLRGGATANWTHAIAAGYLALSIVFGHTMVSWLDVRFAHRFAGGPPPQLPPTRGWARVRLEWKTWMRIVLAWAIACGLLAAAIWFVGDAQRTAALSEWIGRFTLILLICTISPVGWTLLPGKERVVHGAASEAAVDAPSDSPHASATDGKRTR